jgi:Mlc titration factor MtfA (ptsG expression regulator)
MTVLAILLVLVAGALAVSFRSKRVKRSRLLATELSEAQRAAVDRQVPLARKLPADLRTRLEGKINLFLDQIAFIGCNGLEVTEDMRLSIAAQACLLVVNTDTWYDHLRTILIYPGAFKSRRLRQTGYVVTEQETVRTGESWARGPVILSWAHAREGAINDHDGHNVVFHEFAHQIDDLSGRTDGVPVLAEDQSFADWAKAFAPAYERHVHEVGQGHATVIDPYGAEGPQEFFAVAVEAFFERPLALGRAEPEVYAQLCALFRLDPATWA